MFKPMTLSLSLAAALVFTGVSKADGLFQKSGCTNCGISAPLASPQGVMPSAQGVMPSAQCAVPYVGGDCGTCDLGGGLCSQPKSWCFSMPKISLPKISCPKFRLEKYTVTRTKFRLVKVHQAPACDPCMTSYGVAPMVYPSGQNYASPQGGVYGSAQGYAPVAAPMVAPSGQIAPAPAPAMDSVPAPTGQLAPVAPAGQAGH